MKKRPKPAAVSRLPAKYKGQPAGGGSAPPVSPRNPPPRRPAPVTQKLPAKYAGQPAGGGSAAPVRAVARRQKPKRRKLAAPGESCVLDACYAIAGWRPDLDSGDGLLIPAALEAAGISLMPADLDSDLSRPGLVLGVDLPGPHAVLTVPGGWWSWGGLCDPAGFPDAVIEEAWAVTWPPH